MNIRSAYAYDAPRSGTIRFCQLPGCSVQIKAGHLLCLPHWDELLPHQRREVTYNLDAWLKGKQLLTAYAIARLNALIYVGHKHSADTTALEQSLARLTAMKAGYR